MPRMILVTGSTGFIGRHLVPALVGAGWPVRVLIQAPPGSVRLPWPGLAVDAFHGSLYDPDALSEALRGVHTIFHLASAQWWGRPRDLERVDLGGTAALLEAARRARIGRLVVMSHLGAASTSAYPLLRIKGQLETLVVSSGVPYTIIRSGILFGKQDRFANNIAMLLWTNPAIFLQPGEGENLLHPLYIRDLVTALLGSMDNLDTVDRVLEIGGPEYITFNEVVRTIMRVTNTSRMIVRVPPYTLRFLTRVARRIFPRWPATHQWFDILAGHRTAPLNTIGDLFGIRPVRFEDTLLTYMPGRRYGLELFRFLFRRRRPRGI